VAEGRRKLHAASRWYEMADIVEATMRQAPCDSTFPKATAYSTAAVALPIKERGRTLKGTASLHLRLRCLQQFVNRLCDLLDVRLECEVAGVE
jgi:hypothetical protein